MGFKRTKRLSLDFKGTALEGLEVECRPPTLGALAFAAELKGRDLTAPEFKQLVEMFADGLVSWNYLDDNDQPIPATYEQLLKCDDEMAFGIVDAWMDRVTGVDAPLDVSSNGGDRSVEASLQMEPLSENRAS